MKSIKKCFKVNFDNTVLKYLKGQFLHFLKSSEFERVDGHVGRKATILI